MRVRKVLASVILGGMLAVTGAHASPGPHTGTGSGININLDVFQNLNALEASNSGSVTINGTAISFNQVCVPGPTPAGFHKMQIAGTGGGLTWFIEIGDTPSGDAAGFVHAATGACGFWNIAPPLAVGTFSITP